MMAANGLAKLLEETGELIKELGALQQVVAKKLAYPDTDIHPDGGSPLSIRLEQEIADVYAAMDFVVETHGLSEVAINYRRLGKLKQYQHWHQDPNN